MDGDLDNDDIYRKWLNDSNKIQIMTVRGKDVKKDNFQWIMSWVQWIRMHIGKIKKNNNTFGYYNYQKKNI